MSWGLEDTVPTLQLGDLQYIVTEGFVIFLILFHWSLKKDMLFFLVAENIECSDLYLTENEMSIYPQDRLNCLERVCGSGSNGLGNSSNEEDLCWGYLWKETDWANSLTHSAFEVKLSFKQTATTKQHHQNSFFLAVLAMLKHHFDALKSKHHFGPHLFIAIKFP